MTPAQALIRELLQRHNGNPWPAVAGLRRLVNVDGHLAAQLVIAEAKAYRVVR